MRRSIRAAIVLVLLIATMTVGHVDARTRKATTRVVAVQATTANGQITAITGRADSKARCEPNRTVDVLWGPDTAQQNAFGNGTTSADGSFSVSGTAPAGSFITVQVNEVKVGKTLCKRGAFFGQL
jgi:hypothetical protein